MYFCLSLPAMFDRIKLNRFERHIVSLTCRPTFLKLSNSVSSFPYIVIFYKGR